MFSNHPTEIDFEELMAGDIYSAALIFWEIANRVTSPNYTLALSAEINGKSGPNPRKLNLFQLVSLI